MHFADRLCEKIREKKTPLCVGIDPRLSQLPDEISQKVDESSLDSIAGAFCEFGCAIIDQVAELVPIVKPQIAFFEQYGWQGLRALSEITKYAREKGLLVLMDAKRGDIGSTAEAYAAAFLNASSNAPLASDALTVNPYLGDDSIEPFLKVAKANGKGIFVLVKTSNKGGKLFQDLVVDEKVGETVPETSGELPDDKVKVFDKVAGFVESNSQQNVGKFDYGICGAVVGATYPAELEQLRKQMPHVVLLIPGFGAQGGKASDISGGFDDRGFGAIVNSSRQIIFAFSQDEYADSKDWKATIRDATQQSIGQLRDQTPAGNL